MKTSTAIGIGVLLLAIAFFILYVVLGFITNDPAFHITPYRFWPVWAIGLICLVLGSFILVLGHGDR